MKNHIILAFSHKMSAYPFDIFYCAIKEFLEIEEKPLSVNNNLRANFKTPQFDQSLCQVKILILEILNVFLRLKFSPSLTLNKLKRFETGSLDNVI